MALNVRFMVECSSRKGVTEGHYNIVPNNDRFEIVTLHFFPNMYGYGLKRVYWRMTNVQLEQNIYI